MLNSFSQLWIGVLHLCYDCWWECMKEWVPHAHLPAIKYGPPQETFDDILFFIVAWQHILVNSKGAGPNMVSNAAYSTAVIVAGDILLVACLGNSFNDGQKNVDMKVAVDSLKHRACAFQPHSCVDVSARKRSQVIWWITDSVVLREYQVPDFDFTAVWHSVEHFTTRPTDTIRSSGRSTCRPEIVIFPHSCNTS